MHDPLQESYDEIPYESTPIHDAHPDVLAASAMLLGVPAAPVATCRVLELGCGTGGNIIPIAMACPGAQVTGIDLSPKQIDAGRSTVDALGIANLRLLPLSILDIDSSFGQFDYILCHGVFSWVPDEVRRKTLEICRQNLAPAGVAYISYNAYPGWHIRGMFRDMIAYNARRYPDPRQRIASARGFLDHLGKVVNDPSGIYAQLIDHEARILRDTHDAYIFHEHLEQTNQPLYFHEFAAMCGQHELQFLGESRLTNIAAAEHNSLVRESLARLGSDAVEREQFLDFMMNRTFRRSLVTHAGTAVGSMPSPAAIPGLAVELGVAAPGQDADIRGDAPARYTTLDGAECTVRDPLMKAALQVLGSAAPRALTFDDLLSRVRQLLGGAATGESLAGAIVQCYMRSLVELRQQPAQFTTEISARPRAFALSRLQAAAGEPRITTAHHRSLTIGDIDRLVLGQLDGEQTLDQIADAVAGCIAGGQFTLEYEGKPITDLPRIRQAVGELLPDVLGSLAGAAVLVG